MVFQRNNYLFENIIRKGILILNITIKLFSYKKRSICNYEFNKNTFSSIYILEILSLITNIVINSMF